MWYEAVKDTEMKACPFCGSETVCFVERISGDLKSYGVSCMVCTANVKGGLTKVQAIEAWNRRVGGNEHGTA